VKRAKYVCGVDTDKTIYNHKSIKNLIVARLEKIPLKDEKFNLITCNFVVEHLVNPSEVFNEFNRLLKKNGKLVITTPNSLAYDTLLTRLTSTKLHKKIKKIIWERPEEDTFTTKYKANTPFKLKKLLSEAGFEEEKIQMLHSSDLFTFSKSLFVSSIILNKIFDLGFLKYFKPNIFAIYKKL
jgi:ubiquinone/menaquinone biosynthesis C-methylase UbiE